MPQSDLTNAREWRTKEAADCEEHTFEAERTEIRTDLDIGTYSDFSDTIVWLQRDNDALNASLRTAAWVSNRAELQHAIRELRAIEHRITEITAAILANVHPVWEA